jgi:hypothetical protein
MVNAGIEDADDDDEQEDEIARPSEYESILTLARSKGRSGSTISDRAMSGISA